MPSEQTPEEIKAEMVAQGEAFALKAAANLKVQDGEFADELAMLEARTKTNIVNVHIADGFNIAVFGSLSATEGRKYLAASEKLGVVIKKLRECMMASLQGDTQTAKQTKEYNALLQASDDYSYDMVEIITANPAITKKYLKSNPDKFSVADLTKILEGYQTASVESEADAKERAEITKSFRGE